MNTVFKNHPWPKRQYIGFAIVFDMYPKDAQEKIFYSPALQKNLNFGIAMVSHEMLHFMFYDYLKTKYCINEEDELENKNLKYL